MEKKKTFVFFCISFICVGILFIVLYKTFGFYYETNDDTSMKGIVSGYFNGEPDAHMIYIRYVIGVLLASLYKIISGIDWYGVFMIGVLALSIASIVYKYYISLHKVRRYGVYIALLLILVTLMLSEIVFFQWTTVAAFPAMAVIVMLLLKENKYCFDWETWMIVALAILSFSIRKNVFYMALPMIAIIIVSQYLYPLFDKDRKQVDKKSLVRVLVPCVMIIVSIFAIELIDKWAYSDDRWSEYRRFNSARSDIMDYGGFPSYEGNEEFYAALGLSRAEAVCLEQFGVMKEVDSELFSRIAEYNERKSGDLPLKQSVVSAVELMKGILKSEAYRWWHFYMFVSVVILLLQTLKYKKNVWMKVATAAVQGIILVYLVCKGRFPARIVYVYDMYIIMYCLSMLILEIGDKSKEIVKKALRFAGIVICGILTLVQINTVLERRQTYENGVVEYDFVQSYVESQEGQIVTIATGTFVGTKQKFRLHSDIAISDQLGTGGWSLHSPYMEDKKKQLGIEKDELYLLKENSQLVTASLEEAQMICDYYSLFTSGEVVYEVVNNFVSPRGTEAYVCVLKEK